MKNYYINTNAQPNGDYEVHVEDCMFMPSSKKYLGTFFFCEDAMKEAKKIYPTANGCFSCSKSCHKS